MKKATLILSGILAFILVSCSKTSSTDCEDNHTGNIIFHNESNGFNPDSIHIFLGSTDLGMARLNNELNVGNQRSGKNLYTFKYQGGELYSDSIDVTQCGTAHYIINWVAVSDKRLKKNILPLGNVLSQLVKLNIYSFEYNAPKGYNHYLQPGQHYGFMAQELKTVYPSFVQMNTNGYYSVSYQEMIPLLAQGMKEQQVQIDALKKEVDELKSMIRNQQPVAAK
jgi:hypothetical protein